MEADVHLQVCVCFRVITCRRPYPVYLPVSPYTGYPWPKYSARVWRDYHSAAPLPASRRPSSSLMKPFSERSLQFPVLKKHTAVIFLIFTPRNGPTKVTLDSKFSVEKSFKDKQVGSRLSGLLVASELFDQRQ